MLREAFPKYYRSYQRSPWVDELEEFSSWLANIGYSHRCAVQSSMSPQASP